MRPFRPLILPAILLAAAACGNADPDADDAGTLATVDTVDGAERLTYPADPGPRLGWTVDTLAVLGDALAEDAYQFDRVSEEGLAADSRGELLVLDRQGGRVLRYGPDGAHLATYGGQGEGPGELSQPLGMAVGPGDTIWVSDFSNGRLTGYPPEGGDPRTVPFSTDDRFPGLGLASVDDGFVMAFRPMFNFRAAAGGGVEASRGGEDTDRPTISLLRYDGELEPVDTLWTTPEPPTDMVQLEAAGRVMISMMAREFHPDFRWAVFPDGGVVVSDTAAYLLRVIGPDGTVERVIQRGPEPRAVTEADREAVRQRIRDESENEVGIRIGGGGPDDATRERLLQQRLDKMTFADVAPRIVDLRVDPLDRIWVGVTEESAEELERIDIYDRNGRLVGELRDFPMPAVFLDDGRIGTLRRDDLDVQQVVVLGIGGAAGDRAAAR